MLFVCVEAVAAASMRHFQTIEEKYSCAQGKVNIA